MRAKIFAAAVCMLVIGPIAHAGQWQLTYQDAIEPWYLECVRRAAVGAQQADGGQYKAGVLPSGLTRAAFFARLTSPDGTSVVFLLDPAKVPALYPDANRNGDFADDPKYDGKVLPKAKTMLGGDVDAVLFGPVTLPLGAASASPEIKVFIEVYNKDLIMVYPAGVTAGEVSFGAQKCAVAVVDGKLNGRYDESYPGANGYDLIAIDTDGDGKFASPAEIAPLTDIVGVGGEYYKITVAADGSSLTTEQVKPEIGTLKIEADGVQLDLVCPNGFYVVNGPARTWDLPAGQYQVTSFGLAGSDGSVKWNVTGVQGQGSPSVLDLKDGETTTLNLGPPLTAKVSTSLANGSVAIQLVDLVGRGGEHYSTVAQRNGARAAAPSLKIIDESGKVLKIGAFAYG